MPLGNGDPFFEPIFPSPGKAHKVLASIDPANDGRECDENQRAEGVKSGIAFARISKDIEHIETFGEASSEIQLVGLRVFGRHPAPIEPVGTNYKC